MSRVSLGLSQRCTRTLVALMVMVIGIDIGGDRAAALGAAATCGNHIIEWGEACDDGNRTSNDGCSATCTVEQDCYDIGNTFSFFVWSDSYTRSGSGGVSWVFADAVDKGKYPTRVIPRFWVSTGDIPFMVDEKASLDHLNRLLSGIFSPFTCDASTGTFPYFVAIGNHDIDGYEGSGSATPQSQHQYWSSDVGPHLATTLGSIFQES